MSYKGYAVWDAETTYQRVLRDYRDVVVGFDGCFESKRGLCEEGFGDSDKEGLFGHWRFVRLADARAA